MIKFKANNLIGFGLSAKNLEKLKEKKPIKINGKEIGIESDILIFFGETEQTMYDELVEMGLITKETEIRDDDLSG